MIMHDWISWFRHASPYINQHRKKRMVLALSGEAIAHENFINIVHDIALLNSLGIRIVLVLGARPQIDDGLKRHSLHSDFCDHMRVTSAQALPVVLEAYGRVRSEVEARLSTSLVNSPMHGARLRVVSGNFVTAKPIGVINGVDFGWTGQVRRIDVDGMLEHADSGDIVIQTAQGCAVTGEIFNLSYEDLAVQVAQSMDADKLIFFNGTEISSNEKLVDVNKQFTVSAARSYSDNHNGVLARVLGLAASACLRGVKRVHVLSYEVDGMLLQELFTRDGAGTMVTNEHYDEFRPAELEDLNGILDLIQPLEDQGVLVRRTRELIETELDAFVVNVRDNAIIACAALYHYDDRRAELACFAVNPDYRREGRGDKLLEAVQNKARTSGVEELFVLTTQTEHWFLERGFALSKKSELPDKKIYDSARNAKVLKKKL
jgi:amino-acid N-acetyltransferase